LVTAIIIAMMIITTIFILIKFIPIITSIFYEYYSLWFNTIITINSTIININSIINNINSIIINITSIIITLNSIVTITSIIIAINVSYLILLHVHITSYNPFDETFD
jgi:hypothetical protein